MLREAILKRAVVGEGDPDFRWRGTDVSRLENLSDIVFAFALSLIVASTNAPRTFSELAMLWRDVVAFGLCFLIFLVIWNEHYLFSRRYGLSDSRTTVLTALLLFLVLVIVYPLRFIATFLVALATGALPDTRAIAAVMTLDQAATANMIYAGLYACVFTVFVAMNRHALRQADALEFDDVERRLTRKRVGQHQVHVAVAAFVILLAAVLPKQLAPLSGAAFVLIGPGIWLVERRIDRT